MGEKVKIDVSGYVRFLQDDIWRIRARKLPSQKSFWIRQLRIILLALRGFAEDKCQLQASALTFFSLLSIVPTVAMAFGVAKGFGMEKILEGRLMEQLHGQEEVAVKIIGFANMFLENTKGGIIAGIGVVVLFWTVIKLLESIENSFNIIWGIKKGRTLGRKASDYLSMMLVCPFLFIISSSITVLITSQVKLLIDKLSFLGPIGPFIFTLLGFLPYAVIWILFTFIYIFIPNTKVNFRSGFIAGIISGSIYQVVQWAYLTFQIGVSKYGAIYGSFAALPLFLVWLQISWLIVLFGAEISFAEQNVDTYEFESDSLKVSYEYKKLIALTIAHICVQNFHRGVDPLTSDQISDELDIPVRLVRQVIFELTEAGVLTEVKINNNQMVAYQPAMDIAQMTIQWVINRLNHRGIDIIPVAQTPILMSLKNSLDEFQMTLESSPANRLLKDVKE